MLPPSSSTSAPVTSSTRNRNGTATPPPPPAATAEPTGVAKIRRTTSVSRSLGAPERVRHLALVSSISRSFDPYSIFLTPHYTDEQLRRHRGWMRLMPNSYLTPLYVLLWYWPPLLLTAAVSVAVALYETHVVPVRPTKSVARSELAVPFQLTSFCLSILLVFRTTASYERWNEARKIWGSIGVETRTIARQARAWVERSLRETGAAKKKTGATAPAAGYGVDDRNGSDGEDDEETKRTLAELLSWCAAAPIALKAAVATDVDGTALLKGVGRCVAEGGGFEAVLTGMQRRSLWRATAGRPLLAPQCVLDRVSRCLASLRPHVMSDILLCAIDQRVAAMAALASTADRLKRQPIPPAYTRNTSRFLAIWLFFLPLALWNPLKWWSVPASVIISFLLVAVENVGSQLESPHPLLPVDELVSIAVNGVRDSGGRWYLDPHEREQMEARGRESEGESESEELDGRDEVAATVAATKETV